MKRWLVVLAALGAIAAIAVLEWPASNLPVVEVRREERVAKPAPTPSNEHLLERPSGPAVARPKAVDAPANPKAPAPAPVAVAAPSEPPGTPDGPVDKRGLTGARLAAEHESVKYAFETLHDDITACLDQWRKVAPSAPGEVMLSFEIDRDGLQRSWLEHDGELPLGPSSCFANAVYGIDWSHIVDSPAKLTMRFAARDGG